MSQFLIQLISTGGILAIFLTMAAESAGIPISSEIVVPLGGALASQGRISFLGVVAAASLGNLAGSLAAFGLTKKWGEPFILGPGKRIGLHQGHIELAHRLFDRFGLFAVFGARLLPVVRTYISFPAALSTIGWPSFTVATLLGAIPWNLGLAYAGLKLGENWENVAHFLGPLVIPLGVLLLVAAGVAYYYGQRITVIRRPDQSG